MTPHWMYRLDPLEDIRRAFRVTSTAGSSFHPLFLRGRGGVQVFCCFKDLELRRDGMFLVFLMIE